MEDMLESLGYRKGALVVKLLYFLDMSTLALMATLLLLPYVASCLGRAWPGPTLEQSRSCGLVAILFT
jgi:hypothetical protein